MQIDMHYGAVYYLACLAGIDAKEAEKIAWSSQFVDDAKFGGTVQFGSNGDGCICINSAHRYLTDNISAVGRLVWIPFHFVPGSTTQGSFLDRLKCEKDSDLAKVAIRQALKSDAAIRPYRFGVALHAYADTWAHYGFSGLWSDSNLVDHVEPTNVQRNFWESVKAWAGTVYAEFRGKKDSALGHLLADVCPDLPYLQWRYQATTGLSQIHRDNPKDYKLALDAIYQYMLQYSGATPILRIPLKKHWEIINELIEQQEDNPLSRLSRWSDEIFKQFDAPIPEYDQRKWTDNALGLEWNEDICIITDAPYASFLQSNYWRFCVALRIHLELIVGLLSKQGLCLI